jgi:U3 small nucleolar ribonucleoprotein protein IMP4
VITFANHDDFIAFRHHTYKKTERGKDVELAEIGPRFQLRSVPSNFLLVRIRN